VLVVVEVVVGVVVVVVVISTSRSGWLCGFSIETLAGLLVALKIEDDPKDRKGASRGRERKR